MSMTQIVIIGFAGWAVINTGLFLMLILLTWHEGRQARRRSVRAWDGREVTIISKRSHEKAARQIGGWR
jgi:hypothetical protein